MQNCQIHCLQTMPHKVGYLNASWQKTSRIRRAVKRRFQYSRNLLVELGILQRPAEEANAAAAQTDMLDAGDLVRVRTWPEIRSTLNNWNQLKGCAFMEEMQEYCGTEQRIFKRVDNFLDERDYLMKKTKNIYLLKDVLCEGTRDFGPCDRSCFFFWRREWLERISPTAGSAK